jgi:hypothetical protein
MFCVQVRPECWTSQGSLLCSPWQSVCHAWKATDATHKCVPGCEIILAVTASWLISVCGFCLCAIRSWNSQVWWLLGMKELLNLLQRCWVGKAGPIPWPGRSCEFTLLGSVFCDLCHRTHLYWTISHSAVGKTDWNWTCFETCCLPGFYTA